MLQSPTDKKISRNRTAVVRKRGSISWTNRQTSSPLDVEAVNAGAKQKAQPLYAAREPIFAKRAEGNFRRLKWIIMLVTLGIYYITPWLRWDRGVHAPDQAVLIDMANRRFYFFFIEIWPQEFFFVAGLLVMAGVGLFLVTSVVGRAWCGYTCPQTVWTDLGRRDGLRRAGAVPVQWLGSHLLRHARCSGVPQARQDPEVRGRLPRHVGLRADEHGAEAAGQLPDADPGQRRHPAGQPRRPC